MIEQSLVDDPRFKDFFDFVYIDEKWFYLSQKSEKYYLLPEEDEPHRTCKNKNYIPRLMFLCVCARPRFRNGECVFDGKIGCFPLITYGQAIRRSENRLRGEQVIKPITSITREVIRDFMINRRRSPAPRRRSSAARRRSRAPRQTPAPPWKSGPRRTPAPPRLPGPRRTPWAARKDRERAAVPVDWRRVVRCLGRGWERCVISVPRAKSVAGGERAHTRRCD